MWMRERGQFTLIAVDPGKTTGVAVWEMHTPTPIGIELAPLGAARHVRKAMDCEMAGTVFVICEAFVFSARTLHASFQPDALEVIGMMRLICWEQEQVMVTPLQQASSAKSLMTDARLKDLGWWVKGKGHANDALRHMGLYAAKHGYISL